MIADTAFHSTLSNLSNALRRVVARDANGALHGGLNSKAAHQIRRDNPSQLSDGAIVGIVCGGVIFVLLVMICLVHRYRPRSQLDDLVQELRQLEENASPGVPNRNEVVPSTGWKEEVQRWQNKHDGVEAGTTSGIVLSPRSKSQSNTSHTNSGNESSSRERKTTPGDDGTGAGPFSVGSASSSDSDDGEIQTPVVTDISVAKALPIINAGPSLTVSIAKGEKTEVSVSSSSAENDSTRGITDPQGSASADPIQQEEDK
ncbi:hypothetical protein F5Y13DRAFT_190638 [Hypoxylon sp. FL1857]|nr:hypothetical protein F5Y13DRAFT_190638 [Hypoxylon sp. FL1857]